MTIAGLIRTGIIILGSIINCFILVNCVVNGAKIKKENVDEINSEIIVILITINFILFVIYGLIRNIE